MSQARQEFERKRAELRKQQEEHRKSLAARAADNKRQQQARVDQLQHKVKLWGQQADQQVEEISKGLLSADQLKVKPDAKKSALRVKMTKQQQACAELEQNLNYQPLISDNELIALVCDQTGPLHQQPKTILAIQPSSIESKQGIVFQLKFARPMEFQGFGGKYNSYVVDDSVSLLVKLNGRMQLCSTENMISGKGIGNVRGVKLDDVLKWESLHDHIVAQSHNK